MFFSSFLFGLSVVCWLGSFFLSLLKSLAKHLIFDCADFSLFLGDILFRVGDCLSSGLKDRFLAARFLSNLRLY